MHLLGVEETPNGRVECPLFVSVPDFLVHRTVHEGGNLHSDVVAPETFSSHALSGTRLGEVVAEVQVALRRGKK